MGWVFLFTIILSLVQTVWTKELVVYSARKEHLLKPVLEEFKRETGIAVNYTTGKAAVLLQRLLAEGKNTQADMLITVDAGNLWAAEVKGLFTGIKSSILSKNIPNHLRDHDGHWFGLSVRARTIVYNTNKVKASELSTYENLSLPKWKGRLCLRTSKKVYNQSLVATMIAHLGRQKTRSVLQGWIRNLATPVFSSDTKMMEAIAAGQCDVGIGNTYYLGRLHAKKKALNLKLFWPNQRDRGVHVNISGAGIIKYSKKKKMAQRLLEWLSGARAQKIFADVNMEYPVNPKVKPSPIVKSWGSFKQDNLNLVRAGELQTSAIRLMDEVSYK